MLRTTVISIILGSLLSGSTTGSVAGAVGPPVAPPTDGAHAPLASLAPPTAAPDAREVLLEGHRGPDRELIEWAIGRFDEVGLEVPGVRIVVDPADELCAGVHGRFVAGDRDPKIVLCLEHRESYEAVLYRRRTMMHELAHAWDHATLTEQDRLALQPLLGVDTWYGGTHQWEDRGAERLAETLVWGFYDQLRRPVLIDVGCGELHRDFVAITGHRALGPTASVCDLPERDVPRGSV
jgi:hypothetical protein